MLLFSPVLSLLALSVVGQQFTNPVLWEDLADTDVIRVNDTYYLTSSTMHYSPGAPILRSYDLVNWEYISHAVPRLDWGSKYDLTGGQRAYVEGIWASTFNYRKSSRTYYWLGCIRGSNTQIYTAPAAEGPWSRKGTISNCYYDAGLLVDPDTDIMYVAYGNTQLSVAQLSSDGLSQARTQNVFNSPSNIGTLEGSRFYKRNGNYYIFVTKPANGQYVLKASSPWGPYTSKQLLFNIQTPIAGGGIPHQGGLVETQNGVWYYMAFVDSYPGGRIPVLAPITWDSDGFPVIQTVNGGWGASYPYPLPKRVLESPVGTDTFNSTSLSHHWEWNHNPEISKFSVGAGLKLETVTVTNDLYVARNTVSRRILGPASTATIVLDYSGMKQGDRAGLALLRDQSAWIGIKNDSGTFRVIMVNGVAMNSNWSTRSTGSEVSATTVTGGKIWLRASADIRPGSGRQGRFSYSTDGKTFTTFGNALVMNNDWHFFMGYRFAVFNYATTSLGGEVIVEEFTLTAA
ncbi:glycoside hydrolase family 43 protein [Patellaria atrata CBS 101060]|uniref:Glycoside hydrolase family 43 protein n=1 Tax=Patellaria atrata CBS 101060 TaxID=1346257 RepID=A0A9P4S9S5_9PEZI|nr:glycoside hydrolase family 43 protein [Patellaria atrata CBS 101060]